MSNKAIILAGTPVMVIDDELSNRLLIKGQIYIVKDVAAGLWGIGATTLTLHGDDSENNWHHGRFIPVDLSPVEKVIYGV